MDDLKPTIGWAEWCVLPELDLGCIPAKVDTGARTSSLHATDIQLLGDEVSFTFGWTSEGPEKMRHCQAKLIDRRAVTCSGGAIEERLVIATALELGRYCWPVELTLTDRSAMGFPLLLGRQLLQGRVVIDPTRPWLLTGRRRGFGKSHCSGNPQLA